jgi:anhydro-N-acetylmuramic acid kinase
MIIAGVMSGTSADGINVALVRVADGVNKRGRGRPRHAAIELLCHAEFSYPKNVRKAVLAAMNAERASVADLARLNFLLAELYAEAVAATQRKFRLKAALVGCHGQTLYHQGEPAKFLGRQIAATWQTGEAAILAERLRIPVISDFRPADIAAGGKGAPLVPFLDYMLYRDEKIGRVVQNIGGIANLTAIPAGASSDQIIAFDTGPGNMVMDALTERLFGRPYDRDGKIAASGTIVAPIIARLMRQPFFLRKPPKTAGREEFGREFVTEFFKLCGKTDKPNIVATATALTARSIADALRRFVLRSTTHDRTSHKDGAYKELIISGGGAKNPTLMAMLANELKTLGLQLRSSDEFGLPAEAKEAAAFALLAYETWNRRPSNMPSATGAKRAVVLGKISYP